MPIHKVEGGYVISKSGFWKPGSYVTRRAARLALSLPDTILQALQDNANVRNGGKGGRITEEDLRPVNLGRRRSIG